MLLILETVLPVFALVLLGYHAGRTNVFNPTMIHGLSGLVSKYGLPAFLFMAMVNATLPPSIEWGFVASFFVAAFAVFGIGLAMSRFSFTRMSDCSVLGFAGSFSNLGLIGLPVITDVYGPAVAVPIALLILFQSPLLFTTATFLAESERTSRGMALHSSMLAIKGTLLSPVILAMVAGIALNLLGLSLPGSINRVGQLIAQTALPCACFALGASLAFNPTTGSLKHAASLTVLKNVIHPLITWFLAAKVFGLPMEWLAPAVVAASLPIGLNVYAFAERYKSGREVVAMSLLLSTIFFPVSISVAFLMAAS